MMPFVMALIKSLDIVVAAALVVMLLLYLRPLYHGLRSTPDRFAIKLLCGILWSHFASALYVGGWAFEFWVHRHSPAESLLPWQLRLLYLFGLLNGVAVHIATWFRGQWPTWPVAWLIVVGSWILAVAMALAGTWLELP